MQAYFEALWEKACTIAKNHSNSEHPFIPPRRESTFNIEDPAPFDGVNIEVEDPASVALKVRPLDGFGGIKRPLSSVIWAGVPTQGTLCSSPPAPGRVAPSNLFGGDSARHSERSRGIY